MHGKHGSPGVPGRDGRDGREGRDGAKGDQGLQGKTGPQGPPGNIGSSGVKGQKGAKGEPGTQGPTDQKGLTGQMPPKNWKECVWKNVNDGQDSGLIKVSCTKRVKDTQQIFKVLLPIIATKNVFAPRPILVTDCTFHEPKFNRNRADLN